VLFVCYPRCTTCRKARQWLIERGFAFTERDIKKDNPTAEELRAWHFKSGLPLKRFWNTSGIPYREHGIKEKLKDMTDDEQFDLLATDGMLVKRPILVSDDFVLVGFKEEEWEAALKK